MHKNKPWKWIKENLNKTGELHIFKLEIHARAHSDARVRV
jgi:hypothetical protein